MNLVNGNDIPMGLGMALAQNVEAMNYFSSLSQDEKNRIIEHTHQIGSKEEMQSFVNTFSEYKMY